MTREIQSHKVSKIVAKSLPKGMSHLTAAEQRAFRKAGLKKSEIADMPPKLVAQLTGVPPQRCKELVALLQFERMDSVGPATAEDLVMLGYYSLESLRRQDPRRMYERLCRMAGARLDPCVEDVFRAVVAQARDPKLPAEQRNWWYWTARRKAREST